MAITGAEFIQRVQVKLNRIDTSEYEDVRPEEVLFFGYNALKSLTLGFDLGQYPPLVDVDAIKVYLAHLHISDEEDPITDNAFTLPEEVLKFKDLSAFVSYPATDHTETGWVDTRALDNIENTHREDNPFTRSFPDKPIYRLIDLEVKFEVNDFIVTKARYDYLKNPVEFDEGDSLDYPFTNELEDKTVTLILENLESRRISTQPQISRS